MTRRLAYADPPYPGQERRYAGHGVVHLPLLVAHLREFDGWALSTSASALRDVWALCPEARCAAWAKTYTSAQWSRVTWSWEPVLFVTDRRGRIPGETPIDKFVNDSIVCAPNNRRSSWSEVDGKGGGSKPRRFLEWLLKLLDWEPGDELVDLFPGSGGLADVLASRQPSFDETHIGG